MIEFIKEDIPRIISGGQTGVDQGALDFAIAFRLSYGGWAPQGWITEDGLVPDQYRGNARLKDGLRQSNPVGHGQNKLKPVEAYKRRTKRNIDESDGTLILCQNQEQFDSSIGTKLTWDYAEKVEKPHLLICPGQPGSADSKEVADWIIENEIKTLNVAGPRESRAKGIQHQTALDLKRIFYPKGEWAVGAEPYDVEFAEWQEVGENYGRAVAGEAVLHTSIHVLGAWLHITAIWVHGPDEKCECDQQGTQHAADGELEDDFSRVEELSHADEIFRTTKINGLNYVLYAHSFAK